MGVMCPGFLGHHVTSHNHFVDFMAGHGEEAWGYAAIEPRHL
jgi:hypothetical protein